MSMLIPIKYSIRNYPSNIIANIQEIAAHFDKSEINPNMEYSLHTEYSFGKRKFNTELIKEFITLSNSHKNFIPKLWFNSIWAEEFAQFIIRLVTHV